MPELTEEYLKFLFDSHEKWKRNTADFTFMAQKITRCPQYPLEAIEALPVLVAEVRRLRKGWDVAGQNIDKVNELAAENEKLREEREGLLSTIGYLHEKEADDA